MQRMHRDLHFQVSGVFSWREAMDRSAIVLLVASAAALAQSTAPAFEVVSVKLHTDAAPARHLFQFQPGGRFHASNTWIKFLVEQAYDLKDYQVIGGPGWITI